jgi:uncharacterized protein (TIGR03083 family)
MVAHACHRNSHLDDCAAVGDAVALMAAVVATANPTAPVPTCPGWTMTDLVTHIGAIHRWATRMVAVLSPERIPREQMTVDVPEGAAAMAGWLEEGVAPLLTTLRVAAPDAVMWAWGLEQTVAFWSRRMVHETTVHRADAELAAGRHPVIDGDVAVDGIDELLDNLPCAAYFAPAVASLTGAGEQLAFVATDDGVDWRITLGPDGFSWEHGDGDGAGAAATIRTAAAGDLELVLYGRIGIEHDAVSTAGDPALVERWLTNAVL